LKFKVEVIPMILTEHHTIKVYWEWRYSFRRSWPRRQVEDIKATL